MAVQIVVTQPVHADVQDRLRALGDLRMNPGPEPWARQALRAELAQADVMVGFMTDRVDADTLAAAPRLRHIACALKGFDNYDLAACAAAGVTISIVPDLLTVPTAELAIGLAIGLGRHVRDGDACVREGRFRGWRPTRYGQGLDGSTVVVIGLGAVGCAIADRLRAFGCRLVGVDPRPDPPRDMTHLPLAQALPIADWVMLALPLTDATHHLIGAREILSAPPHALWVNVGRGGVIDEAAMAQALQRGRAGGYATDVFAFEDWGRPGRPTALNATLRQHPRTLFTPHLGSAVAAVRRAIEHRAVDNVEAVLTGRSPPDAV